MQEKDISANNADEMLVKAQLAASIKDILNTRNLTQAQAAEMLGLPQPKLSRLLHGHFRGVSEAKMMDCIARLGRDVRIVIGPEHRTGRQGALKWFKPEFIQGEGILKANANKATDDM